MMQSLQAHQHSHSHSSSPRRSSSSAATTPKASKKIGAPKAKGAIRAKSGCYTCRIRRKKCDEQPNEQNRCQTCVRLRLQCLGFGQKRPEWLKENNNVTVFREKIKDYLAAQGMIKGHAGSAARNGDQQDILVLVADAHDPHHHSHSHSRSGPPSPSASSRSMSASSDDHDHRTSYGQMNTSNIRDRSGSAHYPALSLPPSHHGYGGASAGGYGLHQELSPDSPLERSHINSDLMLPYTTASTMLQPSSSASSVSISSSSVVGAAGGPGGGGSGSLLSSWPHNNNHHHNHHPSASSSSSHHSQPQQQGQQQNQTFPSNGAYAPQTQSYGNTNNGGAVYGASTTNYNNNSSGFQSNAANYNVNGNGNGTGPAAGFTATGFQTALSPSYSHQFAGLLYDVDNEDANGYVSGVPIADGSSAGDVSGALMLAGTSGGLGAPSHIHVHSDGGGLGGGLGGGGGGGGGMGQGQGQDTTGYGSIGQSIFTPLLYDLSQDQNALVRHYLDHVLNRQYFLADKNIANFFLRAIQKSPAARDAACLLSGLHQQALRRGMNPYGGGHGGGGGPFGGSLTMNGGGNGQGGMMRYLTSAENKEALMRIWSTVKRNTTDTGMAPTEDEALSGLIVVSAYLFDGGRGAWGTFLQVAADWVENVLGTYAGSPTSSTSSAYGHHHPQGGPFAAGVGGYGMGGGLGGGMGGGGEVGDATDFLLRCTDSQRFIIKTTFWFDILASTTTGKKPRFLPYYRQLWSDRAYIEDPMYASPQLSMLSVMGCHNSTALAIAEISALQEWKEGQMRRGGLSVVRLVQEGTRIEERFINIPGSPVHGHGISVFGGGSSSDVGGGGGGQGSPTLGTTAADSARPTEDELITRRRLTANIFRATAKVYLHSVISGDYPSCPEIRSGVQEMIALLRSMPPGKTSLSSSVLRSVVFGICLCGCLTDVREEREVMLRRLREEDEQADVGNCSEARRVMERVWEYRDRARMREMGMLGQGQGGPGEMGTGEMGRLKGWREVMSELGAEALLLV